jgi:phosphohistidine phosphatase SixA
LTRYVVRHAKAGHRETWDGDDDTKRPLTKAGWRQARALAERLADAGVTSLWSSPYVRCVQTLESLAERLDLPIAEDERLAEGTPYEATLELLDGTSEGAVLCTHGDVLNDLIDALLRRGAVLTTPPDWRKATVWAIDGQKVTVEPPPAG